MINNALTYAQEHRAEIVSDLQELLRIPTISTMPEHIPNIEQAAKWLADKLAIIGLENIQIMPTDGLPVVYADWLHAGSDAPTLLIYGHYDVQPVDPLDEWLTPPFEPVIKGDDIFARGATDDKGQLYAHIAAVEAYLKSEGRLPINIKFLLESEEEVGSPSLEQFVSDQLMLLKADVAVISDTPGVDIDTPAIITGVRGLVYMEVSMRGSRSDLHSGLYGGVVQNPLNAMAKMLASLHDEDGRVTIPGFYDEVQVLTPAEREIVNINPLTDELVIAETGAPAVWGEKGYTPAERVGVRPTLDVHGIRGGFVGSGAKTVIPAKVTAKVSMRLVPYQNPQEIVRLFEEHILNISPVTMDVSVKSLEALAESSVVDIAVPAVEAAATAYEQGFGKQPIYIRVGGTLPVVSMFSNLLNLPVVLMGFGLPDDGMHAPNEKFHLPNLYRGIETAIHYYNILASVSS